MITKDRLAVGVAAVVGAVVGFFAGTERPILLWTMAGDCAGLIVHALFDLLWRLFAVVLVIDVGLVITHRWSDGMTCPMLCLLTTEVFCHYMSAMCYLVDTTLSYWFPEHAQKDQEAFLIPALRSARG